MSYRLNHRCVASFWIRQRLKRHLLKWKSSPLPLNHHQISLQCNYFNHTDSITYIKYIFYVPNSSLKLDELFMWCLMHSSIQSTRLAVHFIHIFQKLKTLGSPLVFWLNSSLFEESLGKQQKFVLTVLLCCQWYKTEESVAKHLKLEPLWSLTCLLDRLD